MHINKSVVHLQTMQMILILLCQSFRSLWNYYINEKDDSAIENNDDSNKISNNKTIRCKSFDKNKNNRKNIRW